MYSIVWSETAVFYSAFFLLASLTVVLAQNLGRLKTGVSESLATIAVQVVAVMGAFAWSHDWTLALLCGMGGTTLVAALRFRLSLFTLSGHLIIAAMVMSTLCSGWWGIEWIHSVPLPEAMRVSLYGMFGLMLVFFPVNFAKIWLQSAIFGRREWRRPRTALGANESSYLPKVSLHVPCYAEPPDIVIETLNALSRLDYPDYEVIVIDNNTQDPALWKPLERHCARLGERFRFFHAEGIKGAKAGALNHIAPDVAPDAELVACIDSDYIAEPDFLRRLAGYFADPQMGFIQTSHDYREWEDRPYQKACYWEYLPFYKQYLAALSEWTSAFTVGTMCIIRRRALQEAGGWAEWCLTEDSELAMRVHALGYKSIMLADTFGRGLIPETFEDYKKQRFRWTAGPAQQLRRHYRLLIPGFLGGRSGMTSQQKYFELFHCSSGVSFVFALLASIIAPVITLQLASSSVVIPIPTVLLVTVLAGMTAQIVFTLLEYDQLGGSFKDMFWGSIANMSLQHTREVAALAGYFSRKPLRWNRTNKFKALPMGLSALSSTRWETARGVAMISIAVFCALHLDPLSPGLATVSALLLFVAGVTYLTAPFMAMLGERDLIRQTQGADLLSVRGNGVLNLPD